MIEAETRPAPTPFTARLTARAAALAQARAQEQRGTAPARWRDAKLLWPLFTKG